VDRRLKDFLIERARVIGGSDIPAVLGLSPFTTPLQLYVEKLGWRKAPDRMLEQQTEQEWHYWGHALELPIAHRFASKEEADREVVRAAPSFWVHPEHSEIGGHVDFIQYKKDARHSAGVLDCKNTRQFNRADWTKETPPHVEAQVQSYIGLGNSQPRQHRFTFGSCAVLVGGCEFFWDDFDINQSFIDSAFAAAVEFMQRIVHEDPPEAGPGDYGALRELYPDTKFETIDLPEQAVDAYVDWVNARTAATRSRKLARESEVRLREMIGGSAYAKLPTGTVLSLKKESRRGHTIPPSTGRVLRRVR